MKKSLGIDSLFINGRLCFIEIWSNKTRSFLTSFGIFLGVTALLVNIAFIRAIDDNVRSSMEKIGGLNIITLKRKTPSDKNQEREFERSPGLRLKDADVLAQRLSYIRSVLPCEEVPWRTISAEGKRAPARICAIGPEHQRAYNIEIAEGRGLTPEDHLLKRNICIMGKRVAQRLFGAKTSPVGKQIVMNQTTFIVAGLIKTDDEFSSKARYVYFPHTLYTYRFGGQSGEVDEIALELKGSEFTEQAISDISRILHTLHRGIDDVDVETNLDKVNELRAASTGIKVLLISIAVITLVVGGISIMNIMFAAIGDRIREIGIRKALGAQQQDLFLQFIIEAILLCFVGGIPGLILGSMITLFPDGIFPINPVLTISDYMVAVGFTIITGVVSGLSPAIGAAKMQPVDALRY